jgi:hypothetical protein
VPTWPTDMLSPFTGALADAPTGRCMALGILVSGLALWHQRRHRPGGTSRPRPVEKADARHRGTVVATVAGEDR